MAKKPDLLIKGNTKLGKNVATFSLPAGKEEGTCALTCKGCYAMNGTYRYPSVVNGLKSRYQSSLEDSFVDNIIMELQKKKHQSTEYIRIHAAGDFYSQEYIEKWNTIVEKFPDKIFYAYTKQNSFNYDNIKSKENFILIDSLQHGLNFGDKDYIDGLAEKTGAIVCPVNKETKDNIHCGVECILCMQKDAQENGVLFYKH